MKSLRVAAAALVASLAAAAAFASSFATPEEAKAMAERAAAHLEAHGPEKSFEAFNSKNDASFHDRDLYVFVFDASGKVLAHGANALLVDKNMAALKDVDGKPFVQETIAVKDAAWVDYKWQNPQTKAVEAKTTYVVRAGQYVVGVGAYKR
jgi:signal transduction histidine kinase